MIAKWMKQLLAGVLAAALCCTMLSGCKEKSDNGPTTSELMSQYAENYVAPEDVPTIWLYGKEDVMRFEDAILRYNRNCNNGWDASKIVRLLSYNEITSEQFGTKVQTEIMSGKGPDVILTGSSGIFSDVNKAVASGAFQSWDNFIADWDEDDYFEQIAHGGYSPDGKAYMLPLSMVPTFVVTTKTNMEKYGFTEEDFSDFYKTTDTLLRLWEEIADDETIAVNETTPKLSLMMHSLFDYDARKTSLTSPETQQLLQKWKTIAGYQAQRTDPFRRSYEETVKIADPYEDVVWTYAVDNFDTDAAKQPGYIFGKNIGLSHIVEFMPFEDLIDMFNVPIVGPDYTEAQQQADIKAKEDLVFFPLCDTEGKIAGRISSYALLSANCKNTASVQEFITYQVMLTYPDGTIDDGVHYSNIDGIALGKYATVDKVGETMELPFNPRKETAEKIVPLLDAKEMNLIMWNDVLEEYNTRMMENLETENPDWEDLETDINIYLSE